MDLTTPGGLVVPIGADASQLLRETKKAKRGLDTIQREAKQTTRAMRGVDVATKKTATSMNLLGKAMTYLSVGIAVEVLRRYADGWKEASNKLRVYISDNKELIATQNTLFRISQKTWSSYESTVTLYNKMLLSQKALNASSAQMQKVTEAVGYAVSLSGADANTARGALLQFGQALSTGRVYAEEFNSIIEGTPRLAIAIADGLGYASTGALKKALQDGKVLSKDLITGILKEFEKLKSEFGKAELTIGKSFTLLSNAFQKWLGRGDEATGTTNLLAQSIKFAAVNFELLANALLAVTAAFVGVKLVVWTGKLYALAKAAVAATIAFKGMAGAMLLSGRTGASVAFLGSAGPITKGLHSIGKAIKYVTSAGILGTLTAGLRVLVSLLRFVVGPIGIVAAALTGLYVVYKKLTEAGHDVGLMFKAFFGYFVDVGKAVVDVAKSMAAEFARWTVGFIPEEWVTKLKEFGEKFSKVWDGIKAKALGIWSDVKEGTKKGLDKVAEVVSNHPIGQRYFASLRDKKLGEEGKRQAGRFQDSNSGVDIFNESLAKAARGQAAEAEKLRERTVAAINKVIPPLQLENKVLKEQIGVNEELHDKIRRRVEFEDQLLQYKKALAGATGELSEADQNLLNTWIAATKKGWELADAIAEVDKNTKSATESFREFISANTTGGPVNYGSLELAPGNEEKMFNRAGKTKSRNISADRDELSGFKRRIDALKQEAEITRQLYGLTGDRLEQERFRLELEQEVAELTKTYGAEHAENYKKAAENLNYLNQRNKEQLEIAREFESVWKTAIDSFGEDLLRGEANFKSFAQSIIVELGKIIIKQQVASALNAALGAFGFSIPGFSKGGIVESSGSAPSPNPSLAYASGGYVSGKGGPRSDSIAARLSNGEFVVNAAATRNNRGALEAINSGKGMTTNLTVNIENSLSEEGVTVETYKQDEKTLNVSVIRDEFSGGGLGRQIRGDYGLRRRGV